MNSKPITPFHDGVLPDDLSDKVEYPYTLRLSATVQASVHATWQYYLLFGFRSIGILYTRESYGDSAIKSSTELWSSDGRGACLHRFAIPFLYSSLNSSNKLFRDTVTDFRQSMTRLVCLFGAPSMTRDIHIALYYSNVVGPQYHLVGQLSDIGSIDTMLLLGGPSQVLHAIHETGHAIFSVCDAQLLQMVNSQRATRE